MLSEEQCIVKCMLPHVHCHSKFCDPKPKFPPRLLGRDFSKADIAGSIKAVEDTEKISPPPKPYGAVSPLHTFPNWECWYYEQHRTDSRGQRPPHTRDDILKCCVIPGRHGLSMGISSGSIYPTMISGWRIRVRISSHHLSNQPCTLNIPMHMQYAQLWGLCDYYRRQWLRSPGPEHSSYAIVRTELTF